MINYKETDNYIFIDYLKGIAIIMVILTHVGFASDIVKTNFLFPYFIYMAVPIFMLITGFNYANSYIKRNCNDFKQMYNLKLLITRFLRLTIPFIIILLLEYICHFPGIIKHSFMLNFFQGGIGRGNYYFPIMLQLIFIFPILYHYLKRFGRKFLIFIFLISLLFEIICATTNLCNGIYRLISIRYFFLVSLGSWLKLTPKISTSTLITSFAIGINAITLFMYNAEIVSYPFNHWRHTNLIFAFYIFPIFAYIYYNFAYKEINNIFGKVLQLLGKASWHIFLIQMFVFGYLYEKSIFDRYCSFSSSIIITFICLLAGILYYITEKKAGKIFYKK